ncbi:oxygen-independent coproporphyrinogen III oxidase [Bacteriovoracaceae bacterium]|nr:oxygen-independent coproporphyrinogen III oxidase [Bacteriovoracaceae bacterium]
MNITPERQDKWQLLQKYAMNAPRYTSYPPFPFWKGLTNQEAWRNSLKSNLLHTPEGIDLYIHIPFCDTLCYFCGCNKLITKDKTRSDKYILAVAKEWRLYLDSLGDIKINSLHFGGGTPSFLTPTQMSQLLDNFKPHFTQSFIGSIEIDPREFDVELLDVLKEYGFSRLSFGVQDFDPQVQESVNRIQPFSLVEKLTSEIRKRKFDSLNFDLIYGLPHQTIKNNQRTVEQVIELEPDLIAFYLYAHLPAKIKVQKAIPEQFLPTKEVKFEIFENACKLFNKNDYHSIGLDHFAKSSSFLYQAKKNNKLYRNFMGYVDKKSRILLGLGVSAISNSSDHFIQNEKVLNDYYERIDKNELPFYYGHTLSETDKIIDKIIQDIMCNYEADISLINKEQFTADFIHFSHKELDQLKQDELISIDKDELKVTGRGEDFLRNIARCFDSHLFEKSEQIRFSRTH